MKGTVTFQVTATLSNGIQLTHDLDSQNDAHTFYTNEVKHNTNGRILTIAQTTSRVKYRIHALDGDTLTATIRAFNTQEEAETFLSENDYAEGSRVVKETRSTTVESTPI